MNPMQPRESGAERSEASPAEDTPFALAHRFFNPTGGSSIDRSPCPAGQRAWTPADPPGPFSCRAPAPPGRAHRREFALSRRSEAAFWQPEQKLASVNISLPAVHGVHPEISGKATADSKGKGKIACDFSLCPFALPRRCGVSGTFLGFLVLLIASPGTVQPKSKPSLMIKAKASRRSGRAAKADFIARTHQDSRIPLRP
jgi:hypothetical protein